METLEEGEVKLEGRKLTALPGFAIGCSGLGNPERLRGFQYCTNVYRYPYKSICILEYNTERQHIFHYPNSRIQCHPLTMPPIPATSSSSSSFLTR